MAIRGRYHKHKVMPHSPANMVNSVYEKWRKGRDQTFAYLHYADLHSPLDPPKEYIADRSVDKSIPNLTEWDYTSTFDKNREDCVKYRKHRLRLCGVAFDFLTDELHSFLDTFEDDTFIIITGNHGESHWEHPELAKSFTDSRPLTVLDMAGHHGMRHLASHLRFLARMNNCRHQQVDGQV
ncbi:hypothetical protein [Natrinema halophilum]|uniref:Sulfatase N-terminal domain-containing protein n=1 Tax=Natrinema halophilum TaxID=1699371 RepID=A0A7D5H6W7_9EURY|nr:hypothetical protein [Natrinema halophilum]QLG48915.1 hypothetical protein HYG82_08655 [Natrinema halophilum]